MKAVSKTPEKRELYYYVENEVMDRIRYQYIDQLINVYQYDIEYEKENGIYNFEQLDELTDGDQTDMNISNDIRKNNFKFIQNRIIDLSQKWLHENLDIYLSEEMNTNDDIENWYHSDYKSYSESFDGIDDIKINSGLDYCIMVISQNLATYLNMKYKQIEKFQGFAHLYSSIEQSREADSINNKNGSKNESYFQNIYDKFLTHVNLKEFISFLVKKEYASNKNSSSFQSDDQYMEEGRSTSNEHSVIPIHMNNRMTNSQYLCDNM